MKRIFSHLKPLWPLILASAVLTALSSLCQLLLPTLMSDVVDEGIYRQDFPAILTYCLQMLLIALVSLAANALGTQLSSKVVARFSASLRSRVFHKVTGISHRAFGIMDTGALVTRSTQDIENVSWAASMLSTSVISIPAMFLGGVALAFRIDPVLASIVLCAVPLVFIIVTLIGRKVAPLHVRSSAYIDRQNELIRAFRREPVEHQKIADATEIMADNIIRANVSMQSLDPIATFLLNGAAVVILYAASLRMQSGISAATGGDVLALVQYIAYIMTGVLAASHAIVMLPNTLVACRRILEVMDVPDAEQEQGEDAVLQGSIQIEHLTFAFEQDSEPAVRDINMEIRPGKRVAIIGSTGSGKSTLVSLLLIHGGHRGNIHLGVLSIEGHPLGI